MAYKLICIDMDGTLLDNKGMLSQENVEAVHKVYQEGMIVAIATGRGAVSAEYHFDFMGVEKGAVVALNGAYVKEKGSCTAIHKCVLPDEEVKKMYELIAQSNIRTYFSTQDMSISNMMLPDEIIKRGQGQGGTPTKCYPKERFNEILQTFAGEILKVSIVNENNLDMFLKLKKAFEDLGTVDVVRSDVDYVEMTKLGCSKGSAVKLLAEYLGIDREEVICIGDNENDISMIKYAGLGIAMGNGCELAKQAADFVTDTNVNSGVAKAINKILWNRR